MWSAKESSWVSSGKTEIKPSFLPTLSSSWSLTFPLENRGKNTELGGYYNNQMTKQDNVVRTPGLQQAGFIIIAIIKNYPPGMRPGNHIQAPTPLSNIRSTCLRPYFGGSRTVLPDGENGGNCHSGGNCHRLRVNHICFRANWPGFKCWPFYLSVCYLYAIGKST